MTALPNAWIASIAHLQYGRALLATCTVKSRTAKRITLSERSEASNYRTVLDTDDPTTQVFHSESLARAWLKNRIDDEIERLETRAQELRETANRVVMGGKP